MNDNIPYINLLCNNYKMQKPVNPQSDEETTKPKTLKDDNEEIMQLLHERLQLGRKRYGHGVIVDQDTRKFGTPDNDWELMALEELLDGLVYTTAAIIRHRRQKLAQQQQFVNLVHNDTHKQNAHQEELDYII